MPCGVLSCGGALSRCERHRRIAIADGSGMGTSGGLQRETFERLLVDLRPKLHRYCARMTGSVVDGEDVLQDALIKAIEAFGADIDNLEGWLFRIAHNAALDHLRRRARQELHRADEEVETMADPVSPAEDRLAAAANLRTFMRLPVAQRSSIILMDVLGYSLAEIEGVTHLTIPAIKASLHRGRARLRQLVEEPEDLPPPTLADDERARLAAYVERFNARDFDAVRDMLADEVRLDLVNRTRMKGREVVNYFSNYEKVHDWQFVPGLVDRRPAILVRDPAKPAAPNYFVLLDWANGHVETIRDFRYARYAVADAEVVMFD
jgi:RNA polymerase sigma-70 factor (ECF subfamily)